MLTWMMTSMICINLYGDDVDNVIDDDIMNMAGDEKTIKIRLKLLWMMGDP